MRIRKNAKLSPLLFSAQGGGSGSGSVPVESHVCQLNQSPWDVIPFDSDSIQFDGDDSFTAGDSIGPVESVASMMDSKVDDVAMMMMVVDDNGECQGVDAKGWPCKNGTKQGQQLCDHHFSLLRSYNKKTQATTRARARTNKKTTTSNPYEFYYYSGFGPLWGKRRGDRNGGEGSKNAAHNSTVTESEDVVATATPTTAVVAANNNNNNIQSSTVEVDINEELDYVDYIDDEEEDGNSGKKRMRKPVKARSLKSLM